MSNSGASLGFEPVCLEVGYTARLSPHFFRVPRPITVGRCAGWRRGETQEPATCSDRAVEAYVRLYCAVQPPSITSSLPVT